MPPPRASPYSSSAAAASPAFPVPAAYGKGAEEQKAARVAAQKYSGRRGWLDSAADAIARGLKVLDEVQAWETRRKVA